MPNISCPVRCLDNGILYVSIREAAQHLQITETTLQSAKYRATKNQQNWFFCLDYEFEILPRPAKKTASEIREKQYEWARQNYRRKNSTRRSPQPGNQKWNLLYS